MEKGSIYMRIKYKLSVDTGGTFTDLCLLREDNGEFLATKVSSTPADPAEAVIKGIKKIISLAEERLFDIESGSQALSGEINAKSYTGKVSQKDVAGQKDCLTGGSSLGRLIKRFSGISASVTEDAASANKDLRKGNLLESVEMDINFFLHGTTVATNALLQGFGARSALLITRGFRDLLYIGRQNRPHLYDFWAIKPEPLIPRHLTFEVTERILACGGVHLSLEEEEVQRIIEQIKEKGVDSVAVSFLHSYINPVHEQRVKELFNAGLPQINVTLSSEILPEFREYERTSTAVINALVQPEVDRYLGTLEQQLAGAGLEGGFYVMQSNGGVISARQAREQSVRTVLSGPAGGVLAGVWLSRITGRRNLITADMGGTSMDICLIHNGVPRYTNEGEIGGYPLRLPMVDVHTIGAGGGSIAWIDAGGALRVGPRSAGASPGPACYGLGGDEPTVTDANLVLGRLRPYAALAGDRLLNLELARKILAEKIVEPLKLTVEKAAEGIIQVVNAGMLRAMRVVSVQRGYDPREFVLTAFGGAGPLHAVELARELGMSQVLVPRYPGVNSAFGMLAADVRHDYVRTRLAMLEELEPEELDANFKELALTALAELQAEGFAEQDCVLQRFLDLRYAGQSYELTIAAPARISRPDINILKTEFHYVHEKTYGFKRKETPLQLVALRLVATGKLPQIAPFMLPEDFKEPLPVEQREVIFDGMPLLTPVYNRQVLGRNTVITGPAVIEQPDATALIWPGDLGRCDKWGNLIIELGN
jgi:N-methylhydantoinase A